MLGACKLNNKSMRNIRREASYQCMAIDLAMLGVISKEECEMLIGCGIPKGLILPNGSAGNLVSEKDLPKNEMVHTEPQDTDNQDTEQQDTEQQDTDNQETDNQETDNQETGVTMNGDDVNFTQTVSNGETESQE